MAHNVSRAIYENTTAGPILAHWKADPTQWDRLISEQNSRGRRLGKIGFWIFAGLGLALALFGVVVMLIAPARVEQGRELGPICLAVGGGFAAGLAAWAMIWDNWRRKVRNMRELGGDVWLTTNGVVRGPDCFPWNHVEKSTKRHYTFVEARLLPGSPAVMEFEVLSTYGPPEQRLLAATEQVVVRVLFGRGFGALYAKENLRFQVDVPAGREPEAAAAVRALLDLNAEARERQRGTRLHGPAATGMPTIGGELSALFSEAATYIGPAEIGVNSVHRTFRLI